MASSADSPDPGSDDVPPLTVVEAAEVEPEAASVSGVSALEKLPRSQASCSGVNGGALLIICGDHRNEESL